MLLNVSISKRKPDRGFIVTFSVECSYKLETIIMEKINI